MPVKNLTSKALRISTLVPLISRRQLWFAQDLPPETMRQMREYRPLRDAGHDDFPDAVEGAIRLLRGLFDKRGAY